MLPPHPPDGPPSEEPVDPRSRASVELVCDVRQGHRPWQRVRLHNISPGGFCMDWAPALEINRPLWIRIAGLNLLEAKVRWKRESLVGCAFSATLYAPVYDHIVRQASSAH